MILLLGLSGCWDSGFSDGEKAVIASLQLSMLAAVPPDPSNRHGDDPAAAAFGKSLFLDPRLSANGAVACASCHLPERQFQDDKPLGQAIGTTARRTMPLAGVQWGAWFFWDGRKDSQWSQALGPLESPVEHGGNRLAYARLIAAHYRGDYEAVFGALPDLPDQPVAASPLGTAEERAAWASLSAAGKDGVNRVFANIGKAIAAFERQIIPTETRFDRAVPELLAGRDGGLTIDERDGLRLFIGKGNCINCHSGPRFTDDHFHNTGVAAAEGLPQDRGRAAVLDAITADPFSCLGAYSDAGPNACAELRFMSRDVQVNERAFKTPSLRGVASRAPYMHAGQIASLDAVIRHYNAARSGPSGHSELVPLHLTNRDVAALVAFLKMLD